MTVTHNAGVATETGIIRMDAGKSDIAQLKKLVRSGSRIFNEQFEEESHLDRIIPKPWGYEYRAYVDDFFDLWSLRIDAPHGTSVHVHPRKLTYLLCLGGQGVTSGLRREDIRIGAGSILRIAPGAFHGTRNAGDEPLELIEVEVPRNKFDLIRLQDDYNRVGTAYESESVEQPQNAMRVVRSFPNARMRRQSPDRRFRFELRTGTDIFYRRRKEDLFHIPLCVSGVVESDVEILTGRPAEIQRPQTERQYLSVSRNL
ncbi:cupin domain-containing protein [Streptomyces ochraceiscleroticus]|uniref:Cupin domain-containing protein n=1 Tax=Streptomyces ochraceiscleroticus TaxID=47761 RepID=A0ABW1MSA2_9ACTN|nr:cupin domain-containing protein [Streptomyces ochraceiscleroticus]